MDARILKAIIEIFEGGSVGVKCVAGIFFFFQAEDGIRDLIVTGVQTCALPICLLWLSFWPMHSKSSGLWAMEAATGGDSRSSFCRGSSRFSNELDLLMVNEAMMAVVNVWFSRR